MNFPIARMSDILNQAAIEIYNPPKGLTIKGWKSFNQFTGGLRPHEFSIICGPTGAGKSTFLGGLVASLIDENEKVFIAPVEVGPVSFTKILLTQYAGGINLATGEDLDAAGKAKLKWILQNHADKLMNNLVQTTYDGRVEVDEMIECLQYAYDVHGAKVCILDNLNYFLKPSRDDGIFEMDEAIHKFVQFTKKTPIHTIMVMHPKKTVGGKITSEFDIKGSSTAVQEASNILLMNRLTEDEQDELNRDQYDREIVFKKLRLRGQYVNQKFYMRANHGRYEESLGTFKTNSTGNTYTPSAKWGGRVAAPTAPAGET